MQAGSNPLLINDSIYFDFVPPPTFAGHINRYPFKVVITSSNNRPHYIQLDSMFSRSYKPQVPVNKWTFLRPECRFYDVSGNQINRIQTIDNSLYLDSNKNVNTVSGTFIGVSGIAEFYFVDDWYNFDLAFTNQPYTTIVATLETDTIEYFDSSKSQHLQSAQFTNSKATSFQPYIFNYRQPDFIKISENGVRDFINPRWSVVQQPIVFSFGWDFEFPNQNYNDGNLITPINYNSNFCKYHPFNNTETITITANGNNLNLFFQDPIKIRYQDSNGYLSSGYNKNYFFPTSATTENLIITAAAIFDTPVLSGNPYSPKIWISNSETGLMSIIEYNFPKIFNLDDKQLLPANTFNFEVPIIYDADFSKGVYNTNGYHGINSIAVLPPPVYDAWACDGELNYLYRFSTKGNILCAIDINQVIVDNNLGYLINNQISPAAIVLDGNQNIWMTLYDTVSVLKFDENGNYKFAINLALDIGISVTPNISPEYYYDNESYPFNSETQNFIEPTFIDTDSKNNVWITCSNYASGFLLKYDSNGNLLTTISYPTDSNPQEIIVNNVDAIWVACANNSGDGLGFIEQRDSNGFLINQYNGIRNINNITLDINQNLWFTYGYSMLGFIDVKRNTVISYNVLDNSNYSKNIPFGIINPNGNPDECALEGIACDLKGYLYVINSIENQVYVYNTLTKTYVDKFFINPNGFTYYNKSPEGPTEITFNPWSKSAQANGDWIGTKWINKYYVQNRTINLNLTGQSTPLNFLEIESTSSYQKNSYLATDFYQYIDTSDSKEIVVSYKPNSFPTSFKSNIDIYKVNENFDLTNQIQTYVFTPSLLESTFLFQTFLPSIYGTYPFNHDDLGIFSYERIANFVKNNSDVDTCGIDQLYNLAQSTGEDTSDYRLTYPSEIKKLMDLLSVNQSRLWGSPAKNQNNFIVPSDDGVFNRGQLLSFYYEVTAGVPVILRTKSLNKYQLIQTGPILSPKTNTLMYQYPLELLVDFIGINQLNASGGAWTGYYEFFEFIPQTSQIQIDGLIDWSNPQTTLNQSFSTCFDWVGFEQTVDALFSFNLYKGMGIIPNGIG